LVVAAALVDDALTALDASGQPSTVVGTVVEGDRGVVIR
jgi:hypothetical protein